VFDGKLGTDHALSFLSLTAQVTGAVTGISIRMNLICWIRHSRAASAGRSTNNAIDHQTMISGR
jgi:hypothetical protein